MVKTNEVKSNSIAEFKQAMSAGIELISEAARIYVEAIDSDDSIRDEFYKACPQLSPASFNGLEAVGRGLLDKRLLYATNGAFNQLKRLPLSQQRAALDNGVDLLLIDGDRLVVKTENLTKNQRRQVFNGDRIRSLSEQRAWLEGISMDIVVENKSPDYEIKRGKLLIYKPCSITKQELTRILSEVL